MTNTIFCDSIYKERHNRTTHSFEGPVKKIFLIVLLAAASACTKVYTTAPEAEEAGPTYLMSPAAIQWIGLQSGEFYVMPPITFYSSAGAVPRVSVTSSVDGIDPTFNLNCERAVVPTEIRDVCTVYVTVYSHTLGDAFITVSSAERPTGSSKFKVSVYQAGGKGNVMQADLRRQGAFIAPR